MPYRKAGLPCLIALGGAMLWSGAASAQVLRPATEPSRFGYVFGEYDYYSASGGSANGGGLGLGWRVSRYLGIEAGGQYASKSGVNLKNGYAQLLFALPLSPRFTVTAAVGGSYAQASTTVFATKVSVDSSGYRAGIGMEYWLSPRWGLRLGVHRQNAGGVADDIGAGIAFRF